jgi:hypothetical protein
VEFSAQRRTKGHRERTDQHTDGNADEKVRNVPHENDCLNATDAFPRSLKLRFCYAAWQRGLADLWKMQITSPG